MLIKLSQYLRTEVAAAVPHRLYAFAQAMWLAPEVGLLATLDAREADNAPLEAAAAWAESAARELTVEP